ncbi:hypothetical protein C9I36_16795 [Pectobacterium punjabense]|nr:hypothetical protein C9I36_16795 [Pectobacterium punjabense]
MAQRVVLRRKISMRRRSYAMYSGELIYVDHKQYRRLRSFLAGYRSFTSGDTRQPRLHRAIFRCSSSGF